MAVAKWLSGIIGGLGTGVSKVMGAAGDLKRITTVDKTQLENNMHAETSAVLASFKAEMGKENKNLLDSAIDAYNRLVRPTLTFLIIYIIWFCVKDAKDPVEMGNAFRSLPNSLWGLMMTVVAFYFGGRYLQKRNESNRPVMSRNQHNQSMAQVETMGNQIIASNQKKIDASNDVSDQLRYATDADGDGLDDAGVDHTKDAEGYSAKMYKCTAGYRTIGYGINLDANHIPKVVADLWFSIHAKEVIKDMERIYPFIKDLDPVRHWICIHMGFNLGVNNKKTLRKTMVAIAKELDRKKPKWSNVARVMKSGKWYRQVKRRSKKLVKVMISGSWSAKTKEKEIIESIICNLGHYLTMWLRMRYALLSCRRSNPLYAP